MLKALHILWWYHKSIRALATLADVGKSSIARSALKVGSMHFVNLLLICMLFTGADSYAHDVKHSSDEIVLKRRQKLYDQIRCPTCVAQSIKESGSIASRQMRDYIDHRIAQGATDDEIANELVGYYGKTILMK